MQHDRNYSCVISGSHVDVRFKAKEATTEAHLESVDGALPRASEESCRRRSLDSFSLASPSGEKNWSLQVKSLMRLLAQI